MAKTKKALGADIDWYLISIDKLKKFGLGVLIVLLAVGGVLYYNYRNSNPRQKAQRAIADAQNTLDRLASSKDFNNFRTDFDRARTKLDESKSLLFGRKFPDALSAAVESQTIAQAALSRQPGEKDADAQFLSVEGEVSYQKSGGDWKPAEGRMPLFNGDWVKTGNNSTAELMFANGSLYTVGQNGLLEIYSLVNPLTSKKQNTVKMQIGSIEVNTDDENSTVRTPGSQVVVESKSTAQVGVDEQAKSTQVVNLRGTMSVSPAKGGPAVQLTSGQKVVASADGALSAVSKVILPPAIASPADNQVFQSQPGLTVDLRWNAQEGAAGYRLQLSRSRLFSTIEIDTRRKDIKATVKPTDQGAFYWRVASTDAAGQTGPFSTFRRFRVTGSGHASVQTAQGDKTPPMLQVKRPFNIGGQFYMIEGKVEPGASVYVNDEEIDVDTSGAFKKFISFDKVGWNTVVIKAVDAAGNQTIHRENVYVEE
jgi:hypothetical protein